MQDRSKFSTSLKHLKATFAALAVTMPFLSNSATLIIENFEGATLDSHISYFKVGAFGTNPGVQNVPNLGGTRAFGFGLSTCALSCFGGFTATLSIELSAPTFVTSLVFREMELFGNWGSSGIVFVDGIALGAPTETFGRLPTNDRQADLTYRNKTIQINNTISRIAFGVTDITNQSEIFIDNIVVSGVPEPLTSILLIVGLPAIAAIARTSGTRREKREA